MNTNSDIFSYDDASQDPQLTLTPSQNDLSSTYFPYVETEREKLIWGTSINIERLKDRFKEYIRSSGYMSHLERMNVTREFVLTLDLHGMESELSSKIINYPLEALPICEAGLQEIYQELYLEEPGQIRIRPTGGGRMLSIRDVDPKDIEKLVTVRGMIVRVSGMTPELKSGVFECVKCHRRAEVASIKGMIVEPTLCECGAKLTFEMRHNLGDFVDRQFIKVQELAEQIPEGTTPMTMNVVARADMVDCAIPGDKTIICGVLKAVPVRINPILKKVKSSFRVYLEILSIKKMKSKNTEEDEENENYGNINNKFDNEVSLVNPFSNDKYLDQINALRFNKNIYDILSRSIAPSICGMEDVKKGLLLQLLRGVSKDLGSSKIRGDINILLAGDPGIAKSQLLSFVHRISERGMYTSGRGSSAVGLTASVSKDPISGEFVLESGALVLSDDGICCVDEFDKMSDNTRSVLHEAMEQQTVSLAKAGIITTLNARCSILASCNPVESRYNPKKSIVENINIPPTLMSRFDLVFLLIDKSDAINDRQVANHILGLYSNTKDSTSDGISKDSISDGIPTVSATLLKEYIKEAHKINPKLTDESISDISRAYVQLRQLDDGDSITATTRQLESLVRLSEAHARMRFSMYVEPVDVAEAVRLIKESLLLYAVDPRTGKIDVSMIITGRSAAKTRLLQDLKSSIVKLIRTKMSFADVLNKTGSEEKLLKEALNELENEDLIYFDRNLLIIERIK